MKSFALLADPVRRRIVEILSDGERSAGEIGEVVGAEFRIRQPAVSNQLRLLRDADVVQATPEGSRRLYSLSPGGLDEVTAWVARYSRFWPQRLDALETELARGDRASRRRPGTPAAASHPEEQPCTAPPRTS